jgi:hypothetical protein
LRDFKSLDQVVHTFQVWRCQGEDVDGNTPRNQGGSFLSPWFLNADSDVIESLETTHVLKLAVDEE